MRGRRVDGKKIRRLHGRAWSEDPTVADCQCLHLIFKCREISSPPQHDTDKSQDVTSSATSATEQNTRNRTWHDDSIPKRKRKLSIWRVSREQQGPTRRRTSWEGPGTALGKTRQSKEAENAFINPRSWPGRRTAMGVADEAVMVCVCVCGWWSRRCMSREGKKKKKKTGWSIRGGVETNGGSCANKTAIDAGSRSPTMASPPSGQSDGRKPARERDGGQGGRAGGEWRAVRRFAGATPFRRCGVAVPTLCQSHGRGGPIAAVHGCQAQPGCRRRHMHAHRKSRRRLSPSCPFLQVCSQRPRLERRPTAPQATFSCLSLPVPLPPTVRHPPVPIQHRALPPSPPPSTPARPANKRQRAAHIVEMPCSGAAGSRHSGARRQQTAALAGCSESDAPGPGHAPSPWGSMEHGAGRHGAMLAGV